MENDYQLSQHFMFKHIDMSVNVNYNRFDNNSNQVFFEKSITYIGTWIYSVKIILFKVWLKN